MRSTADRLLAALVFLSFVACATRPTPPEVPVEPPSAFSESGTAERPERWWTAFDDPALDRVVERALVSNLDLATVRERLREAEAIADVVASDRLPDLDGFADGRRERADGDETDELALGLSASWEADLWGRIQARSEAERLRVEATREDARAATLSLAAEVARTWFQRLEAAARLALLDDQIAANQQVEQLLENRFAGGQVRGVDVLRQRQLVEATREERIATAALVAILEHRLAVLQGRPPTEATETERTGLPRLPPLPTTGLPSELVRRRPDVRSAYRRLQAADRDLAAAVADRYPRLTLGASVSTAETDAMDLFRDWTRSIVAGLLAPVFRAGALRAQVEGAGAVRARRLLEYGQTILVAWREVEDALVLEARQLERIASLERQVDLIERAYRQLRLQYLNGLGDYIDVLTALTETQRLERDLIAAERIALEIRVDLYLALAGGFDVAPNARGADPDPSPTARTEP